jgi:subfamily B ATP-binding cassette protein MsbA
MWGQRGARVKLSTFLARHLRPYAAWASLAFAAIVVFALSTAILASLVEPIFSEVLLSDEKPQGLGMLGAAPEDKPGDGREIPEGLRALDLRRHFKGFYGGLKERFGIDSDRVVYFVPLLLVIVFFLRSGSDFVSGYAFQRVGLGVTADIRNELYRRILDQSSRFYAAHPSGELVSRVVNDVALMQNAVANRLLDLFQQTATLLVLIAVLLSTHFQLALICLVAAPLLVIPIVRFGKGMRKTSHRSQERMADLAALMNEGVRGHRVVKAFGMEGFEYERFREATRRHLKVNLRAQTLANLSSPVIESLAVLGGAGFLIYAGRAVRAETLTAGVLAAFLIQLLMLYDPIRKLNKVNLVLQEALAGAQRVISLLEIPVDVVERPGARELAAVREGVRFRDVSFRYDDQRPVLHAVNLAVAVGEMVAIVGPSGAGKSTLVNLLPRFFDADGGSVEIDGVEVRDLTIRNLREQIGLVTQDTTLFNDTVRANIAYGRAELPLERVQAAAVAAFADEFIRDLPQGYDTVIGEGGLRLSGGQRQRLAIARAILKNAPILILDEATSQLDSESEELVQKALYNLMQGRTTLVIAHRLATVVRADRIVVMEAGRLVEEGTHAELLTRGGLYKRLYDLQFRG